MTVACFISYWIDADVLAGFLERPSVFLGGMWAAVATVFVFKETRADSLAAGAARLSATLISFACVFLSFYRTIGEKPR
jgi:hypothetical protein